MISHVMQVLYVSREWSRGKISLFSEVGGRRGKRGLHGRMMSVLTFGG